jgi:Zn ribbon nucleic-acid-binding protein
MAEVSDTLHRLGLRACPVCGSQESLDMSHFPAFLADGRCPAEPGADLIFAVRVECGTCGHVMLFNAQKYRTGDEKILMLEPAEDEESSLGE